VRSVRRADGFVLTHLPERFLLECVVVSFVACSSGLSGLRSGEWHPLLLNFTFGWALARAPHSQHSLWFR
jgi:hypothetical protein